MLDALSRTPADIGIDLGTSNTRVVARGKGLIDEQPTVVAIQRGLRRSENLIVGSAAKKMLGRATEGTEVIRPVRGGVIADFVATERLLRSVLKSGLLKPRVLVGVPAESSEVERRAVQESTRAAGAREVLLVATPLAAAIGADLPVTEPVGSMIVDVGGGRTEVAVTSLGGMVVRRSIRVAGDNMDEAIVDWLRKHRGVVIGDRTTEMVKHRLGCAVMPSTADQMRIRGRDLSGGGSKEIDVSSSDLVEALAPVIQQIRAVVRDALRETPPELAADLIDRGIILCGGGARLRGLNQVLRDVTGLPVLEAEKMQHCAALGMARLLDDSELFDRVTATA